MIAAAAQNFKESLRRQETRMQRLINSLAGSRMAVASPAGPAPTMTTSECVIAVAAVPMVLTAG